MVSAHDTSLDPNAAVPIASLFAAHDPDGDHIAQYFVMDASRGGGHLEIDGVVMAEVAWLPVDAAHLSSVNYVGGAAGTSDTLYFAAFDGHEWSANASITATSSDWHHA